MAKKGTSPWKVGEWVKPKPEWVGDPNNVPTGVIVKIEPWGGDGALYVDGERRAFAGYVFERVDMNKLDKKFYGPIRKAKDDSLVPPDQWVCFLAKDNAFAAILPAYYNACAELGADEVHLLAVSRLIDDVTEWRNAHPELCKVPDARGEKVLD